MVLADLNQKVFVPVMNEETGAVQEIQISIKDLLDQTLDDFQLEIVDAIPTDYISERAGEGMVSIEDLLVRWNEEQKSKEAS